MCYSSKIWSGFKKYERLGGQLSIKGYMSLFWKKRSGYDWVRKVAAER